MTSNISYSNVTTEASPISPTVNQADTCWVLISSALVFIMIPSVGFFYGGAVRRKNFLTILMSSGLALSIVSFQWFFWGYTLSFSQSSTSPFIGNFENFALINIGDPPHSLALTIPQNVFMIYQCFFAVITAALAFGSAAERTTLPVFAIFLFIWSTLVYDFIAYWTWAQEGFLKTLGVLDFAGGTPVHITSGCSALAYAIAVGPRRTIDFKNLKATSPADIYIGTTLIWFGWFGFNGGSELAINARASNAVIVTNLAAAMGGIFWLLTEMIINKSRKMPLSGFCNGAVAGLVAITPASGYVAPWASVIFGIVAGSGCYTATYLKKMTRYRYDDACDVFAVHGVGGILGNILTGIFAQKSIVALDGTTIPGGWLDRNFIQVPLQLASIAVAAAWSFVVTFIILQIIGLIPFLSLNMSPVEEEIGGDHLEVGETAYGHDIINIDQTGIKEIKSMRQRESNLQILNNVFRKKTSPQKAYHEDIDTVKNTVFYIANKPKNNSSESSNQLKTVNDETTVQFV